MGQLNRWDWVWRLSYYKMILSIALFIAAMFVQFINAGGATPGAKAAMLATGAASCLFIGLLPATKDAVETVIAHLNRFVGATLTLMASWNWLLSESDGDVWPTFGPALFFIGAIAGNLLFWFLFNLLASMLSMLTRR